MATPWSKIRAEWLRGGVTQKQLAEKYHVSVKTIQNRAYKEGWKKEKGKIREKVEEQTRDRVVRARVNHLERLITAQEDILEALEKMAAAIKDDPKKMLTDKTGSIRNVESITRALQTATMTQRDLYGLKNIDQKFAAKKWREQQKLERELKKEKQVEEGSFQVVVVHEPAEEGGADGE